MDFRRLRTDLLALAMFAATCFVGLSLAGHDPDRSRRSQRHGPVHVPDEHVRLGLVPRASRGASQGLPTGRGWLLADPLRTNEFDGLLEPGQPRLAKRRKFTWRLAMFFYRTE